MKIFRLFSIAAAALMMAACSTEDSTQQAMPGKLHFTATIAAPNSGAGTRTAYTEGTKQIDVAWEEGDEIALVHNGVKDVATVKTVRKDGSAIISGTLNGSPKNGDDVALVYPAALVEQATGNEAYTKNEDVTGNMSLQDGTLNFIQENLDFREDLSQLSVDGNEVTLAEAADMVSSIAIWKLTLLDGESNALQATKVTVKSGENELASTATLTSPTSTVYLALPLVYNQELTIEATVGEDTYSFTKAGVTLNSEYYYQSKVTMAAASFAANEYNEASWDNTNSKVVYTKKSATNCEDVSSQTSSYINLDNAWLTVSGNVTLTGTVRLTQDVHLILQDGATLTINGQLKCNSKNLYIYGQKNGDGKLIVTNNSANAINSNQNNYIEIHGGEVTAEATGDYNYGLYAGYLEVYGGKLTATSGGGNGIGFYNTIDVYDGEVVATSNATSSSSYYIGIRSSSGSSSQILTVYGGKVTATGNGVSEGASYGAGIRCYVKSGTSGIKFYFSDDGTTWGDGTGYASATSVGSHNDDAATKKRYVKAE